MPRVVQVVLQLDPGGTERLVVELVSRLHRDAPMAVCCLDAPGAWASQIVALGIPVVALHRTPGFQPGIAWRVAQFAAGLGAEILHCHHYSPFVYGRLAALRLPGCRVIYTEHGRLSDGPPSPRRQLANRLLMPGVSSVIAVSHHLRRLMLAEAAPPTTQVIHNGVEVGAAPTRSERTLARSRMGVDENSWVVMSVARLDPVKDLGSLIRAVAETRQQVPAVQLVVIGDGSERAHLESVAVAEGVAAQVRFLGHREDVRGLMAGADVYANSSVSEGVSLTILEAMAACLPVVATAVGGTPEVVVDGVTGVLTPSRDSRSLARALTQLAVPGSGAAEMGLSGRERVLRMFHIDRMVALYAGLYGTSSKGPPRLPVQLRPSESRR